MHAVAFVPLPRPLSSLPPAVLPVLCSMAHTGHLPFSCFSPVLPCPACVLGFYVSKLWGRLLSV